MDSILSFLQAAGLLILALSILVVLHELGHYLPAVWSGMRVEKFFLFFDYPRKLWSITRKGTEWGIGLIPFGGYVKIAGMVDESMDTDQFKKEGAEGEEKAELKELPPAQPWEFRAKSVWARFAVMVGGVTMNVILGCAIFICIAWLYGEEKTPFLPAYQTINILPGSVGDSLGLESGDRIISFSGQKPEYLTDINNIRVLLEHDAYYEVVRGGETLKVSVPNDQLDRFIGMKQTNPIVFTPLSDTTRIQPFPGSPADKAGIQAGDVILQIDTMKLASYTALAQYMQDSTRTQATVILQRPGEAQPKTIVVKELEKGKMGVMQYYGQQVRYSLPEAILPGIGMAFGSLADNMKGFGKVLRGDVDAPKAVSGPFKIGGMFKTHFQAGGWLSFWRLTAILSMWLALVNILPIPALDGGHIVFLLMEAVTGREPSLKFRMVAQQIGMIFVLGLMLLVFANDIFQIIKGFVE